MTGDSDSRLPPPERPDFRRLPAIESLEVVRRSYAHSRKHMIAGRLVALDEGVEIIVHTSAPIPIRGLSPALYVGGVEVAENEVIAPTVYRFFVLDEKALPRDAPISLGWAGQPERVVGSGFRYAPPVGRLPPEGRDDARPQIDAEEEDEKKRESLLIRFLRALIRAIFGGPARRG